MKPEKKELAVKIAPAARILLTGRGCVCFVGEADPPNAGALDIFSIASNDIEEVYSALQEAKEADPDVVHIRGVGYFCLGKSKTDADHIKALLTGAQAKRTITEPRNGRLKNKIAVITGGASGFGLGLSRYMAEEGAYIVVADLNFEQAQEKAAELNAVHGDGTAFPVAVDVASETQTEEMFAQTVLEYGGLDIFISCAGVSHGGGLDTMDLKMFEFITKINYTAFYIGTNFASRTLKIENRFDPEFSSDIIQINSKSGLDGSINNFTYAGAKFGGIGLVQSFAKELVGSGVKVNAVCPGNYYDGPMWSDPVKGLFVQYLEVGKVPGAKTVEDVRKYHVDKTPMKRGCTPLDVARAVFYCVEQQYETGQAIPVSGGQIMLK